MTWSFINTFPAWLITWGVVTHTYQKPFLHKLSLLLCIVLAVLATLWFWPQKRALSLFAGYLHGPIYDEWIGGDFSLFIIRFTHLAFGAALLLVKTHRKPASICCAIWLFGILWQSQQPEYNHGHSALQKQLPITYKGQNWTLHTYSEEAAQQTAKHIDFHVKELLLWFPDHDHILIYRYPSMEKKKRWFGGHHTDVADVVTPSLHITDVYTLRHELVHAMSARYAFHGLGFHPNIALTEGLAVALAPMERSLPLHQAAAYLVDSQKIEKPGDLFSPYFWSHNGHQAYTVAGSFLLYLATQTSKETVIKMYQGASLNSLTNESIEFWVQKWKNHILSTSDLQEAEILAQRIFREPSLWNKRCTHSLADLKQYRNDPSFFNRLLLPLSYKPEDHRQWKENFKGALPAKRSLLIKLLKKPKDFKKALTEIRNTRSFPPQVLEDFRLSLFESDLLFLTGNEQQSSEVLKKLAVHTKNWNLGGWRRHLLSRQKLTSSDWRLYLAGWGSIPDQQPEKWIHTWLQLRANREWPSEKVRAQNPDPGFEYAWFRMLEKMAHKNQQWNLAYIYLKKSLRYAPKGHKESIEQTLRLLTFYKD